MSRLFLALHIAATSDLVALLEKMRDLRESVSVVVDEKLHVTLKFLGETRSEQIGEVERITREVAGRHARFETHLRGLGAFPRLERPSVLWCGLSPAEPFQKLASDFEEAVEPLGFEREARAFHPHLTLVRVKDSVSSELRKLWLTHQATDFGAVAIEAVTLFESQLTPNGANYRVLTSAPLA